METTPDQLNILSLDIGGSHIKGTILNAKGELQKAYEKVPTPIPASPENVIAAIKKLIAPYFWISFEVGVSIYTIFFSSEISIFVAEPVKVIIIVLKVSKSGFKFFRPGWV